LYFSTAILAAVFGAVFTAVFAPLLEPASSFRFALCPRAATAIPHNSTANPILIIPGARIMLLSASLNPFIHSRNTAIATRHHHY
jgi:hypothetical protein